MVTRVANEDFVFHLDPFGQQPGLWNLYTQLTFCYPLDGISKTSAIVGILTKGLERLTNAFPWVAGQVVKERREGGSSDYYAIRPFEAHPRLVVKDLRHVLPTYDKYKQLGFPIGLLDECLIAPRKTKPVSDESDAKPVFLLQATYITGGLLLTFVGQHGTMDMVGQGEIIKLLSKASQNTPFTGEELLLGNRDRRTIVPLLDESDQPQVNYKEKTTESLKPLQSIFTPDTDVRNTTPPEPPTNIWANFTFSSSSLRSLKNFAMKTTTTLTSDFISTDDSLSAFIWQCISRARFPRFKETDNSTFARTVDVRRHLNIPPTYPGNLATKIFTTHSFQQLLDHPLGAIASRLRQGIDPKTSDIGYQTRAAATVLARPSSQANSSKPTRDLSRDIAFSSWSKLDYCYDLDFNLGLGTPDAVRRPSFAPANEPPMEGVVYLMPKRQDGEVVATMCLRSDDMERLKADDEWVKYATYVG